MERSSNWPYKMHDNYPLGPHMHWLPLRRQGTFAPTLPKMTSSNFAASTRSRPLEVEFSAWNARNERLAGLLTSKSALKVGDGVTVLCHGFMASKQSRLMRVMCKHLVARGVSVARFDFSGNGDSEGTFRYGNYAGEVEDVRAVVQALRSRGLRVDAVVGHSKGAAVAVLYAGRFGDVRRVVSLGGRVRMRGGVGERFGEAGMRALRGGAAHVVRARRCDGDGCVRRFDFAVTMDQVRERERVDVLGAARGLRERVRVLTVHGESDCVVGVEEARDLHAHVSDGELFVVEGGGHCFDGVEEKVVERVVRFCADDGGGAAGWCVEF